MTIGKPGRTQQQRREETRGALLNAAVESLVEHGFAKTTGLAVQKRAGVSRGALLHHFPSKAELLVATIQHLADLRGQQLKELASALPSDGARADAVLELLWESFNGPLFQVATELRFAARTDPELAAVLIAAERELWDRIINQSKCLFGPALSERPGFESALELTLQFMIGAATTAMLHGDNPQVEALITQWKNVFLVLLDPSETREQLVGAS